MFCINKSLPFEQGAHPNIFEVFEVMEEQASSEMKREQPAWTQS